MTPKFREEAVEDFRNGIVCGMYSTDSFGVVSSEFLASGM